MRSTPGNENPTLDNSLAAESSAGSESDSFEDRLARYSKARTKALEILTYIVGQDDESPQHARLVNSIRNCGHYLNFRDYYTVGQVRLTHANFCKKHLLCPLCAIRRGAAHLRKYHERYQVITQDNPRLKPYLVTFTIKDGDNLQERFKTLYKSIQAYHKRRHSPKSRCEARKAHAAVWSYEIKRGSGSGLWHPHVHAIWMCESEPNVNYLMDEWSSIVGDGSFMCDVRPIDTTDLIGGFCEVFKYATKFSSQSLEDTWHTFVTLSGRRLIGSFGLFRGIEEPEELTDQLLAEDLPYIDRLYHYSYWNRSYELTQETHSGNLVA